MQSQNNDNSFSQSGNGAPDKNYSYYGEYYHGQPIPDEPSGKDEIDLKHLINVSLRYKWWVLSITLIITAIATIYAWSLDPVYQSSGTIMIAEERNRYTWAGSDISSIVSSSFNVGAGNRLVNEIQVFQSRRLAEEVAKHVLEMEVMENGERFPILWRDYPYDSTLVTLGTLTGRIGSRLRVQRVDMDTDILRITFTSISPHEASHLVNITMDTYTQVSATQRRSDAHAALAFLEQEMEEARRALDESEQALRDYMSRTNLVQIDGQTSAVINRITELESRLQEIQVQRVGISSAITSNEQQLEQIRPGLAERLAENISGQMDRAQYRIAELRTQRTILLNNNPALRQNPELEPQFMRLEAEIEALAQEIRSITQSILDSDESDAYIGFLGRDDGGIATRIAELRRNLIELRIQELQLNAQEEAIQARLGTENLFFDGLPDNMIELARLQRDSRVNEQLYSTISQNYTQTTLWEQTQFGAGRPLDYGLTPGGPSGPNRTRYIMIGFLLGGILSVGFVFTKENLNRTIDGTDKLRKTGYPLLAIIPDTKKYIENRFKGHSYVKANGKKISSSWSTLIDTISPIAEAYRRLHNNIIYSNPDSLPKMILITSTKKGEGKTTVSMNLGVALAEAGKRVLVVDTDLRRPSTHDFSGLPREPGLVEYFYDDLPLSSVIKETVAPGLFLLTAGRSIPNPAAVMQSSKLRKLFEIITTKYDHIIIDTPPYGVITDAAPIMRWADAVVLVTRFGDTQTNELNHTIENLRRINASVIGTMITGYIHKDSADYYYSNEYTYDSYYAYEEYQENK
ncbi:MAG: polysaccharide biosynthesis tyrosine autokinase [Balneolaceae bacterium]|nr:MAG: polysaccharide biosynthesis tyrosine autokinase [Balneolaceae bacterium]